MDNKPNKTTNQEITNALEQIKTGNETNSTPLVFDPVTGEFVVAKPNQQVSADATTFNSIVKDGFAYGN